MATDEVWIEDGLVLEVEETQVDEYDLTSAPNDFNVSTIVDLGLLHG